MIRDGETSESGLVQICKDLGWEYDVVVDIVTLALKERRFRVLAPKKEEWTQLRVKTDAIDLLSKLIIKKTGRSWSHEEVVEFRNEIEQEYLVPTRSAVTWETQIQLLFNKEQVCALCKSHGDDMIPEIDHRIPVRRGGSSLYSNLQWLCRPCNRKKQAKIAKEFGNA